MKRPLFFRNLVGFFLLMAILSCSPAIPSSQSADEPVRVLPPANMDNINSAILYYVNGHRHALGLEDLLPIEVASAQAYVHSKDMATGRTGFGHEGFQQRMNAISKITGRVSASAENVAYGELTAKEVVKGWLNSPGHRRNIEGNYTLTGIGIAKDRNGTSFFTQIFLRK